MHSVKFAIFSDIHGNLEALKAVLADIAAERVQEMICLGDIVGYGPNPAECLELIRGLSCSVVLGNHDEACVEPAAEVALNDTRVRESLFRAINSATRKRIGFGIALYDWISTTLPWSTLPLTTRNRGSTS